MNPRERLKRYRKRNGLSVADFAAKVRCSRQFIYALEDGSLGKVPGIELGRRIYDETGIPNSHWDLVSNVKHQRPRLKSA